MSLDSTVSVCVDGSAHGNESHKGQYKTCSVCAMCAKISLQSEKKTPKVSFQECRGARGSSVPSYSCIGGECLVSKFFMYAFPYSCTHTVAHSLTHSLTESMKILRRSKAQPGVSYEAVTVAKLSAPTRTNSKVKTTIGLNVVDVLCD